MMRAMMRSWLFAIAVALTACGGAPVDRSVQTNVPDPPPPQADAPTRERPDFLWIHGHWVWTGKGWEWTSGRWEHVRDGYSWTDGQWVKRGGQWVYVDGSWVKGDVIPSHAE